MSRFAERLRSAKIALPTPITDVLLNRFRVGLPQKPQDQVILMSEDSDTVVSGFFCATDLLSYRARVRS